MTQRQIAGGGAAAAKLPRSAGPGSEGEYSEGRRPARGCRGGANGGVITTPWLAHARLGSSRAQPPHACVRARARNTRPARRPGRRAPAASRVGVNNAQFVAGGRESPRARARVCVCTCARVRARLRACARTPLLSRQGTQSSPTGSRSGVRDRGRARYSTRSGTHAHKCTHTHTACTASHTHTCHTHAHTHTHARAHTRTHTHTCTHTHTHTHTHTRTHTHACHAPHAPATLARSQRARGEPAAPIKPKPTCHSLRLHTARPLLRVCIH